eukprot:CAMPEP_0172329920 /NCGR_PEP_ID=MMETSP1058-20130122/61131_1 /TAXON_ID=83371 /ORGANISM="Detonula confervacea, Strain CCMP 353" /LENGTH=275 /DNA_ID=CAMNT_0013047115 /DNA_START=2740 /DNA_END=3564 /DNA_ORIENTATION=+
MTTIDPLLFHGTLLNQQGDAIKDAKIQLWQTDPDGNYLHPDPRAATSPKSPDHASIVSEFQYFGTDATDSEGNFEFLSYRPGAYPNRPYSHFHFMVWLNDPVVGDDGEDPLPALVTQFYFKDESPPFPDSLQLDVTEVDAGIYTYGSYVNGTIVVDADSSLTGGILLATSPMQPKGPFYPETDFFRMNNDLTAADDATTQNVSPTVSPDTGVITTHPTRIPSFAAPATGPTPPMPSHNNDIMPISTAPTLHPVQVTSSAAAAAAAWNYNFLGFVW